MKQILAPAAIGRLAMIALLGIAYWTVITRSLEQQLCLAALAAAFTLGIAADLLILPRIVLWQIAPALIVATILIWAVEAPISSIDPTLPNRLEIVFLIGVVLLVLLMILVVLIGIPAIVGAAIPWAIRTTVAENQTRLGKDVTSRVSRWAWRFLSRAVGVTLLLGVTTIPTLIPFPGTEGPRVASPDGRYVAWVREFNCGATCPFHPWVVVRDREDRQLPQFWIPDEAIVFETEHTAPSQFWLEWTSERELTIRFVDYGPDATTVQKETWHGVTITYEPVSP